MIKKSILIILSAAIILSAFTACAAKNPIPEETTVKTAEESTTIIPNDDTTFKLSYTQSDSLNPYESTTQNNQILSQLVFEGLFSLDENFKSALNIAASYNYTDSETLKISIVNGIGFSDGKSITADDIEHSFYSAKKSELWANTLNGIKSCSADSDNSLIFRLEYANPYAHNLLTFPVISSDEDDNGFPVGSGRYYYDYENGEAVLKANTKKAGFSPKITTIHLENITSADSIDNAVNIGNISFAFRDLSQNTSKKISAGKKLVNMNNLVYIGINNKSGITANAYIRKAISLAVNRETLVKSAYGNFAQTANSVFNPQFELSQTRLFEKNADENAAKQAILQSGISDLSLTLLVNKDNADRTACARLIKQQLENVGFSVNLAETDFEEYENYITNESFNLYIGETKITNDMNLNTFFRRDGAACFGIDTDSETAQAYQSYSAGDAELGSFLLSFSNEMPYIPLVYRKGMVCFSKAMSGDVQSTVTNCFANMENWYFSS